LQGDALLLIAGIQEKEKLRDYSGLAQSLGLSVLCEVHSEEELDKALASDARFIGINNRDLTTFSVDLNTSMNLAASVPADRIIVSESGIHSRSDIETLTKAGIHAFLIGETLMTSDDMGRKLRELLGRQ
ncbi:MAG: indole-3-glycerol phosphate synthase TrpC, partial [Syntrophales bacterium]